MSWYNFKIMNIVMFSLGLILTGCGGGGGTANGGAVGGATSAVSLTGVVVSGTTAGNVAVGAVKVGTKAVAGALPNAIIIAVDSSGNTKTTSADKAGAFTLGLQSATAYGIVFMDSKTLKVIGSLVQANNTRAAGAVTMIGNADLGSVVVNPATGVAVSTNDANGTLAGFKVGAAGLDTNGDGKISQAEINAAQANTIGSGASLSSISVADFFATPGTWLSQINVNSWSDGAGNSSTNTHYELRVGSALSLKGPNGTKVSAVKESSVTYWASYSNTSPLAGPVGNTGYFASQAVAGGYDYTGATFPAKVPVFDVWNGPWTWADASYADATTNFMYDISNFADPYATWRKKVPLNIEMGKTISNNYTDSRGATQETFVVTLAQENGKNYVFMDNLAAKHLVIQVKFDSTWTPNAACQGCLASTNKGQMYIIANAGGVQADAVDANGTPILPSVAFKNMQFGTITSNAMGKFVSATNLNPAAATTPKLTNAQRDKMLAYVWDARDLIGTYNYSGTAATNYAFVVWDQYGQAVAPASWDPVTYASKPLVAGATQSFTAKADYTLALNGTASFEVRVYNTVTSTSTVVGVASIPVILTAGNVTASVITGSVTVPTLAAMTAVDATAVYSYTDYTGTTISEGFVELWLVIKDSAGTPVMQEVLDWYPVQ